MIRRAATAAVEVAHRGLDGRLHGHSLSVTAWTRAEVDLDAWRAALERVCAGIEGELEATIGGRTFEAVAEAVLHALPEATQVVVGLPSRGHLVEVSREAEAGRLG